MALWAEIMTKFNREGFQVFDYYFKTLIVYIQNGQIYIFITIYIFVVF